MAKKTSIDIRSLMQDIRSRKFAPVYFLHGDESYFIDLIADLLLQTVLTEEEKDFNLMQFYGVETTVPEVISACRRYPMLGNYNLVLFREVQSMQQAATHLEIFESYLRQPMAQTILVITHKEKLFKGKILKQISEVGGVVYESIRLRDYELPKFLPNFVKDNGFDGIAPDAVEMLCNYVGSDLSRMATELDKLRLTIGHAKITLNHVLSHIGISKEYNNFELVTAVACGDYLKSEIIRQYFERNPKQNPLLLTLAALFSYFSNLMLAYYASDKSERGLMQEVGLSYPAVKNVIQGMRRYNAWKVMGNLSLIRDYDAQSKGARGVKVPDSELLKELLYKLMH